MTQWLLASYPSSHAITPLARAVSDYLGERSRAGSSNRTALEYGRTLSRFLGELALTGGPVEAQHVHRFAYGIGPSGRPPSASTVRVRLAAVGGFLDFAWRMGLIAHNPATRVIRPRGRPSAPRSLAHQEVARLIDVIPHTPRGFHDRALVLLIVLTGLRREEALALRRRDIELERGVPFFEARVKGGHRRRRELPAPAFDAIRLHLSAACPESTGSHLADRIFQFSGTTFGRRLRRYAHAAGIDPQCVTPHTLRHTAARLRRDAGSSLEDVRQLLGHRSVATTALYLAQLESADDPGWLAAAALLGR